MKYISFARLALVCSVLLGMLASTQAQTPNYGTVTGSNISVNVPGNFGGNYYAGHTFIFLANASIPGGATTLSINGQAPRNLYKNVNQNLAAGDIQAGQAVQVLYDGTNFQMLNVGGASTSTGAGSGSVGAFSARINNNKIVTTTSGTTWDVVDYNSNNWFNPTTGRYSPQEAGYYHFISTFRMGSYSILPSLYKNGTPLVQLNSIDLNYVDYSNGSDFYEIRADGNALGDPNPSSQYPTYFQAYKINGGGTITVTSFSGSTASGISTLNGLTSTSQNFSTSSTGTSVNIVSSGNTHNFNVPLTTLIGGNNITVTGTFPVYTITGLASSSTGAGTGSLHTFRVTRNTAVPVPGILQFNTKLFDTQNEFSLASYRFTPLEIGFYNFSASAIVQDPGGNFTGQISIRKNGTDAIIGTRHFTSGGNLGIIANGVLFADGVSDYFDVFVSFPIGSSNATYMEFSGFKINGGSTMTVTNFIGGSSTTGISTLNSLTATSQNFQITTVGSSISITSLGNTHTFAIPAVSVVGGNNITVTGSFPLYTVSGLASGTSTSQWVNTSGGISYPNGNVGITLGNRFGLDNFSDQFLHNTNTVGSYSIGWYNDNWNGFGATGYLSAYGGMKFFTNSSPQPFMSVTQFGLIGVNTTSPGALFDVNGSSRFATPMIISSFAGGGTQTLGVNNLGQLVTISGGTNTTQWGNTTTGIYYNNGTVEIGQSNQATDSQLKIYSTAANQNVLTLESNLPSNVFGPGPMLQFRQRWWSGNQDMVATGGIQGYKDIATGFFGGGLKFFTMPNGGPALVERMFLTNTGQLGLGTSTPGTSLDVNGSARFVGPVTISGLATGGATQALGVNNLGQLVTIAGATSTSQWVGTTGGIYYNSGNVGIGTGSTTNKLIVSDNITNGGILKLQSTHNISNDNWWIGFVHGGATADANDRARIGVAAAFSGAGEVYITTGLPGAQVERLRVNESGNVGIGTSTPGTTLDVNGTTRLSGPVTISSFAGNGTQALGVNNIGQLVTIAGATGTTQWASDAGGLYYNSGAISVGTSSNATFAPLSSAKPNGTGIIHTSFGATDGTNSTFRIAHPSPGIGIMGVIPGQDLIISSIDNTNLSYIPLTTFKSNGFVGIGTTTPGSLLDVNGNARFAGLVTISNLAGATTQTLGVNNLGELVTVSGGASQWITTSTGIYYNQGNVGIGTSTPFSTLEVANAVGTAGIRINAQGPFSYSYIDFANSGVNQWGMGIYNGDFYLDKSSVGNVISIASSGLVSIGNAIGSTAGVLLRTNSSINGSLNVSGIATVGGLKVNNLTGPGTVTVDGLGNIGVGPTLSSLTATSQWITNGTSIFYNTGNVGIGTSTPGTALLNLRNTNGTGTIPTVIVINQDNAVRNYTGITLQRQGVERWFAGMNDQNDNFILRRTGSADLLRLNASGNSFYVGLSSATSATGINNHFIGQFSGFYLTTGTANLGIGYQAGVSLTVGNGNVFLGDNSGTQISTGNNNITIGKLANTNGQTNLTNAIAIGYNSQVGASNSMVLGGTGSDAVNVGIGVNIPTARLDVNGDARIAGPLTITSFSGGGNQNIGVNNNGQLVILGAATSQWSSNGSNVYYTIGNVGIGTTVPGAKFDVNGSTRLSGPVTITSFAGAGTQALGVNNLGQLVTITGGTSTSQWVTDLTYVTVPGIKYTGGQVATNKLQPATPAIYSPSAMDDLNSQLILGRSGITENVDGDLYVRAFWGLNLDRRGGNGNGPGNTNYGQNGTFGVRYRTSPTTFRTDLLIDDLGRVGIGTISPGAILDVNGNARFAGPVTITGLATGGATQALGVNNLGQLVTITGGTSTSQWVSTTGGSIFYNSGGGYVGINSAIPPIAHLDVNGIPLFRVSFFPWADGVNVIGTPTGSKGFIVHEGAANVTNINQTTGRYFLGMIGGDPVFSFIGNGLNTGILTQPNAIAQMSTTNGGTFNVNGRIGIATSTPTASLDVVGNARITSNVTLTSFAGGGTQTLGVNNNGQLVTVSGGNSQWVSTTGGIYYNGGDVTHYGKIVGISSINPQIYLDNPSIATGAATEIAINSNAGGTSKYFAIGVNNGGRNFYIFPQGGSSDALNIDFAGNVGIGLPSGSTIGAKLTINGNASVSGIATLGGLNLRNLIGPGTVTVDGFGNLGIGNTTNTNQWITTTSGTIYYNSGNVEIGYPAGGGGVLNVGSNGPGADFRAGYGTAGAALRLGVKNNVLFNTPELVFYAQTTSGMAYVLQSIVYGSGPGASILLNPGAGNIGIGVNSSPVAKLTVGGTASISGLTTVGGLNIRNLIGPGTVTVDGLGRLGVSTSGGSSITGSGTTNGVAFWSNATTLTSDGASFIYSPSTKSLKVGNVTLSSNSVAGNIFLGNVPGPQNMDPLAVDNVFIGSNTGIQNTTGHSNTFIGKAAGQANTIGDFNNYIGEQSGYNNITGSHNNAMGYFAGYGNVSGAGSNNNSFGQAAGLNNEGDGNNFIGTFAGTSNTSGNYNNFLGQSAGYFNTVGSDNIFIGQGSGLNNINGNENIAIGKNTGFNSSNLQYSIAIGSYASVGGSNMMALGGVGLYAVNVGIGTALPQNTLDVVGGARIRNLSVAGAVFATSSGDLYVNTATSNNLWTVSGTALRPTNTSYGVNVGSNSTTSGLVNISSTTNSGLVVSSYNLPPSTGAIMTYSYSSSTAGIGAFVTNSNAVGVYGSSSNSLSTGLEGNNNAGGTAIRASGTASVNPLVTVDHNGTTGTGLRVNLTNGLNTATGLLIITPSTATSQAMDISGKVQLRNYTNGTLTVDGAGNLGVSPSSSAGPGAGFLALSTVNQSIVGNGTNPWNQVVFQNEQFDDANAFNPASVPNGFVAPNSGVYQVNASVPFSNIGQVDIAVFVAGTPVIVNSVSTSPTTGVVTSVNITGIIKLNAGNQVFIQVRQFTGANQSTAASASGTNASFSMVRLY